MTFSITALSILNLFARVSIKDKKHHGIQHKDAKHIDIQYGDTQHKGLICDTQPNGTPNNGTQNQNTQHNDN
jgi:hypothetical protein